MSIQPILEAKAITKVYKDPNPFVVIEEITLDLYPAESVSIMGPSGAGKSTLLHILGTLDTPSSGSLLIDGVLTTKAELSRLRNEKIGFIFQTYNLLEEYTLLDNLLLIARIGRRPTDIHSDAYQRALTLLERVDLVDKKDRLAKRCSGGEKQRCAIARALMNDPALIFADEPSGNLDDANSLSMQDLLLEMTKEFGKTVIIVTHDKAFGKRCDRALTLEKGRLI